MVMSGAFPADPNIPGFESPPAMGVGGAAKAEGRFGFICCVLAENRLLGAMVFATCECGVFDP